MSTLAWRVTACGSAGALVGSVLTWLIYARHLGESTFAGLQPPFGAVGLIAGLLIGGLSILTSGTRVRVARCALAALGLTLVACWAGVIALGQVDNGILAWTMIWATPIAAVVFPAIAVAFAVAPAEKVRKITPWMGGTAAVLTVADVLVVALL